MADQPSANAPLPREVQVAVADLLDEHPTPWCAAEEVLVMLRQLPVEQRMAAMGMRFYVRERSLYGYVDSWVEDRG